MIKIIVHSKIFMVLALFLVLTGCSKRADVSSSLSKSDFKVLRASSGDEVRKIAVMPFSNFTGDKVAARVVASAYVTELYKNKRFVVEEPGNIRNFMLKEKINSLGDIELERAAFLGRQLKVDGIVIGSVDQFTYSTGSTRYPIMSVSVRVVDPKTGKIIWAGNHTRSGNEYAKAFNIGQIRSATTLAKIMASEVIDNIYW